MSSVSLISESSQEVSQYMNRQVRREGERVCVRVRERERERERESDSSNFISSSQVPPTTSAGYSRLKRGIRGVKQPQYPSSQQRPHPGHAPRTEQSGPPPVGAVRNSFQPRQPWQ